MGLQIMLTEFKLKGNRSFLRTDYEMSSINKSEADSAITEDLEENVLPWFEANSNNDSIKKLLLAKERLSVYEQVWLESIENPGDCSEMIGENTKLFGLPKGLGH